MYKLSAQRPRNRHGARGVPCKRTLAEKLAFDAANGVSEAVDARGDLLGEAYPPVLAHTVSLFSSSRVGQLLLSQSRGAAEQERL